MRYSVDIRTSWTDEASFECYSRRYTEFRTTFALAFSLPFGIRSNSAGTPRRVRISLEVNDDEAEQTAAEQEQKERAFSSYAGP